MAAGVEARRVRLVLGFLGANGGEKPTAEKRQQMLAELGSVTDKESGDIANEVGRRMSQQGWDLSSATDLALGFIRDHALNPDGQIPKSLKGCQEGA